MSNLDAYLGKSEDFFEKIHSNQVRKICATLGYAPLKDGDKLPNLWQWCFFVEALAMDGLGRDGHPKLGGFMPPADNRNRMWAGGRFNFLQPMLIGVDTKKKTTIKNIVEKNGRTGKLMFVTLLHEYFQNEILCVSEEQDIVYREPSPPKLSGELEVPASDYSTEYSPSEILLFRYSALTFNGHRIHYDFPYATNIEGYQGLVIHGPLLATYMINDFIQHNPDKKVKSYSYRGLRPLCVPSKIKVSGKIIDEHNADVWVSEGQTIAHQGKIIFD